MTIEFLPSGKEDETLPFSSPWAAINHIEAHEEVGVIRLRYYKGRREMTEELHYKDGKFIGTEPKVPR